MKHHFTLLSIQVILTTLLYACNSADFQSQADKKDSDGKSGKKNGAADSGPDSDSGEGGDDNEAGSEGSSESDSDSDSDSDSGGQDNNGEGAESDDTDGNITIDKGISDKCDIPSGSSQSQSILGGEDVPGNGLIGGPDKGKPFGSDFDDFILTLNGTHVVQKDAQGAYGKIGFLKDTTLNITYARGTTDCAHAFKFILRKCPNKNSSIQKTHTLNPGRGTSGTLSIDVKKNLFLDIEITVTGTTTKQFGGCVLPIPQVNLLYGGGVPVLIQ